MTPSENNDRSRGAGRADRRHRRSTVRTLLLLAGVFLAVTLFFTTSNFFYFRLQPEGYRLSLLQDFLLYAVRWLPWVLVAPAAIRLGRRFPLRGRRWPGPAAVHLAAALALAAVQSLLSYGLYRLAVERAVGLPPGEGEIMRSAWLTGLNYLHNNLVTYFVIVGVVWGLDSLRLSRERELAAERLETELARARLLALQSQVHPHFLFNTLHMISAVVYRDAALADRLIDRLSGLLRAGLEAPAAPRVPLSRELEILDLYLDIMRARFGDRLAVALSIAPDALPALVPSFSLQPLVENAIKHGLLPRVGGGTVRIAAARRDGRLVVDVEDDGPGFGADPGALLDRGVGLRNIRSRLENLYGAEGALRLRAGEAGGARATLDIPFEAEDA